MSIPISDHNSKSPGPGTARNSVFPVVSGLFVKMPKIFRDCCRLFDRLTIRYVHARHERNAKHQPRKARTMSNATAEYFCAAYVGTNYSTIRSRIQSIDFGDCYPVVDSDGNLTGECVPGDADGFDICFIDDNGMPQVHEHATDAMIRN